MSTNIEIDFNCEKCDEYSGDRRRLFVEVPPAVAKDIIKEKPQLEGRTSFWLCDDCVRAYCKDTISDYWFERYFPRSKRNA